MSDAGDLEDDSLAETVRFADTGPKARVPDSPLAPRMTLLDRYLVGEELGRGGMGVVYRAVDRQLGRPLAIKVLARHLLTDEEMLARFLAEAKVTAQLQHPSIVPVFELHRIEDGLRFYTMRLVEGRTLDELARGGWSQDGAGERWTLSRALRILVQVCQAIAYAHAFGVVHRDLKPGNIMVGRFGEVHILDWGLAKVAGPPLEARPGREGTVAVVPPPLAERPAGARSAAETEVSPTLTATGVIMGTPAYMAPEQARGESVDARADVYALGGILYTVLTGRLPREGTTSDVLWSLARGTPPRAPSSIRPDVPASLDLVCLRALAQERAERTPSAADLARALENWLEGRLDGPVRPDDAEFLSSYRPGDHRRPSVTVDVVVARRGAPPRAFLHRRARPPFKGCWAIPGTFVRLEDDLEVAARKVLVDEVHLPPRLAVSIALRQLGAFGDPARDPRTRVITIAYLAVLEDPVPDVAPDPTEATAHGWFALDAQGGLVGDTQGSTEPAFDHGRILAAAFAAIGP